MGGLSARAALLSGLLVSCSDPSPELHVLAASSLTEAFQEVVKLYSARHPRTEVHLSFAGSQTGRLHIEHGAPADLFASAHPIHVDALVKAGLADAPRVFAANELVLLVEEVSPIRGFWDLSEVGSLVLGSESVPVGRYADRVLAAAETLRPGFRVSVARRVVSRESNVRLVRAKVALGAAEAAIIYRSDALAAQPGLRIVELPPDLQASIRYPIVRLRGGPNPRGAIAFVELLESPLGKEILQRHGFEVPE